jgi:dolichol-phosphate mannosyltransferase
MLNVVVPCYNEDAVLPELVTRLRPVLDGLGEEYAVVFVDDGSDDGTPAMLDALAVGWPQVRVVHLARNVGHQIALTAGLDVTDADWVATIDADLQDPPELIADMLRKARAEKLDVVYAERSERRSDTPFKRFSAGVYYRLMRRSAKVDVPAHVGDFRLMSRRVVETLRAMPERNRVYRLLIPWLGFPSGSVRHQRAARAAGVTKYPLRKMVLLAVDSLTSFSAAPLRLATGLGFAAAAICAVLIAVSVGVGLAGESVPGWASITTGMLFLGAVQLICVGVLGEYVGRIYAEVQRRPLYTVQRDTGPVSLPSAIAPRSPEPSAHDPNAARPWSPSS